MSRHGTIGRGGNWTAHLAWPLGVVIALGIGPSRVRAQVAAPAGMAPMPAPAPAPVPPGAAVVEAGVPVLPPEIQVVRFQAPPGVRVEVLGPPPEPIAVADGQGANTYGLKVGVGYRLRLSDLPDRPGAELYPVVEVAGHLHRPSGIDPARFPIRVVFGDLDLIDAADHGRLVTQVVYLEDPAQALPLTLPKDEIPIVTLNPAEDPLKVATALGRVMVLVQIGGRRPTVDEVNGMGLLGAALAGGEVGAPCPFAGPNNGRCPVPCGPVRGTAPPPGRPWIPRDEYLCDGGDRAEPAHFGGGGSLAGIDPRDAVIRFYVDDRPRLLPTNVVCIYAPRFAAVRVGVGPNEALMVEAPWRATTVEQEAMTALLQGPKRLVKNEAAELNRHRARASALNGRVFAGVHTELRVLNGYTNVTHVAGRVQVEVPELARNRQKAGLIKESLPPLAIKTAESAVVTGIIQGAGQMVMTWTPRETIGVEVPPNKPGLAVLKRVSTDVAEPGTVVTFVIQFRNMGNTPIGAVSVVDSLLPRLGYVPGSAEGPRGTVFTAAENLVGSTELRWDLPGIILPGAEGYVSFQALVR